jgi:hypothetical protein
MSKNGIDGISAGEISVWPQGSPGVVDDLLPDGLFGYLNEQVLWLRHDAMRDSRSALRVPEGISWKGKPRAERRPPESHNYQVGQEWRRSENSLRFEACPISSPAVPSPGTISGSVDILDEDLVKVAVALTNVSMGPLEEVTCHFCMNHRRAPLLGRRVFALSNEGWVDFTKYVSSGPYLHYHFTNNENLKALPAIISPILVSETVSERGTPFVSVIGSEFACSLMSNVSWPCTDVSVSFGTVHPGESSTRDIYVGLGFREKDDWIVRISDRFSGDEKDD